MMINNEIEKQINQIKAKLLKLKALDKEFEVEGAEEHQYKFHAKKTEEELLLFEQEHGIILPLGYRIFLKHIGNGGAGVYYGLESLESGLDNDLSKEFVHTEYWNEEKEDYADKKWINGFLKISDFGCGVDLGLVVNGTEYGNVWVDDRINENGIYPDPYFEQKEDERTSFLDWYEMWLDRELMLFEDEEKALSQELRNLKNSGASFLVCIGFMQKSQEVSLLEAKDLFFILDIFTDEEKECFRTSLVVMNSEIYK